MRTTIAVASAAAVLGSVVFAGASPAVADSTRILPIKAADNLLVDSGRRQLLFSDKTTGIVALDYEGAVLGRYALPGVSDLFLTRDAARLYAAVPAAHKIVALDAATLQPVGEYPVGDTVQPYYLAATSGKIWFGYSDKPAGGFSAKENIGSLDVSGEAPVVALELGDERWDDPWYDKAPRIAAAATDTTRIAVAGVQQDAVFDVSDGTAKLIARVNATSSSSEKQDVALSPDGEVMATTVFGDGHVKLRRTSDLDEVRRLTLGDHAFSTAIDIAADGTVAAGVDGWYDPDIWVFPAGSSSEVRNYDFPNTGSTSGADTLAENSLAWENGGNRLFAISGNSNGVYSLRVFTEPRMSQPTLTLTGPQSTARATAITVSGTLQASLALPAGTPVTVTRTDVEAPGGVSLGTRTINASGGFSFTDTPQAGGRVTYRVAYAGDATRSSVSATHAVDVARSTPSLYLNNNGKVYNYGQNVTFTAYLGGTYKNRVVEFYADPWGGDLGRRLIGRATVNAKGYAYASLKVYRNTGVQAVFTGDARFAARSVAATVYSRVPVSLKLGKYYKTGKISGRTFRYYKKTSKPTFTVAMPRYTNREAYLHVDIWYQGRWQTAFYGNVPVNSKGQAVAGISSVKGLAGYKFRVRAAYRKGYSGDSVNYTTYTAYQYFTVSK
ncbi:hypothetical protein Q0Z83_083340 [Actinoplanes sichuanensis]|uniref:WD40 repeat domain-containing protein n=1 Tax=Actinoplanes sichuanensis TaxID=512349 RepID=A0ABW4AE03_9ACTN|nr:WD40 repeat domain-containing protein [Actinoplanes sichuanensis]BEL10143.1 hypothetical protein Q0Z83_083340 [Actinoplanes sichuanensis]